MAASANIFRDSAVREPLASLPAMGCNFAIDVVASVGAFKESTTMKPFDRRYSSPADESLCPKTALSNLAGSSGDSSCSFSKARMGRQKQDAFVGYRGKN